jgi:hypothetical protein
VITVCFKGGSAGLIPRQGSGAKAGALLGFVGMSRADKGVRWVLEIETPCRKGFSTGSCVVAGIVVRSP